MPAESDKAEVRGSREGWARHFLSHAIPFIIEFVSASRRCGIKTTTYRFILLLVLAEKLNSLMMWYTMGKELACSEVPVMDILQEFRLLAGIRGRKAHRGQQPPKYGDTVKVEEAD